MSLLHGISSNARALTTYGQALKVTGNNIANVNTTGYARQVVQVGSEYSYRQGGTVQSTGLTVTGYSDVRSTLLDGQILREQSITSRYETEASLLEELEALLGDSLGSTEALSTLDGASDATLSGGLRADLQSYFSAWDALAASPTSSAAKADVIAQAETLIERLGSTDQALAQMQDDIDQQAKVAIDQVSAIVDSIAQLNRQIASLGNKQSEQTVELESKRQQALQELATYLDFTSQKQPNGMVNISLTSENGSSLTVLDGSSSTLKLHWQEGQLVAGAEAINVRIGGGQLSGLERQRNGLVADARSALDGVAAQLVQATNAAYNPAGTAGNDFFATNGQTASSLRLETGLTATTLRANTPGATTSNDAALAIGSLATYKFSTADGNVFNGTFDSRLTELNVTVGSALLSVQQDSEAEGAVLSYLETQRENRMGVNLDEEIAHLLQFQRSYQATSRVMRAMDEMLQDLMSQF